MKKITEKYEVILRDLLDAKKNDNELDHEIADQVLLDCLKDNGFHSIVELYEKLKDKFIFWYA